MNSDANLERTKRLAGLRRFAIAITLLNVLGHTVFGFEQSIAQPFVAVAAAYIMEIAAEMADAWARKRRPRRLARQRLPDRLSTSSRASLCPGSYSSARRALARISPDWLDRLLAQHVTWIVADADDAEIGAAVASPEGRHQPMLVVQFGKVRVFHVD